MLWGVLTMHKRPDVPDEERYQAINNEELMAFVAERKQMEFLIALVMRPGIYLFSAVIEMQLYTPNTPKNDSFEMLNVGWGDHDWAVFGVPARDRGHIEHVATMLGLRIADGVPMIMGGSDKPEFFPMHNERCFTLENDKLAHEKMKDRRAIIESKMKEARLADFVMRGGRIDLDAFRTQLYGFQP